MDGNLSDEELLGVYRQPVTSRPSMAAPVAAPVAVTPDADLLKLYRGAPEAVPPIDTSGIQGAVAAYAGAHARDLPVVGPAIYSGLETTAAKARSAFHGTKYEDELAAIRAYQKAAEEQHPVTATAGAVSGSVLPMVAGAGAAPSLMGLSGPIAQRVGTGLVSNAVIGAADTAARGGSAADIAQSGGISGVVGGTVPVAGKALGVVGNKLFGSADNLTNALVDKANALGVPIRFAQSSDSPFVGKLAQMAGKLPGSGMAGLAGEQQTAFNRAVAKTFGEDADRITPDVMASAKKRIGQQFDNVATNSKINVDPRLHSDLSGVVSDAEKTIAGSELSVVNKQVGNILDKVTGAGVIDGEAYQGLTRTGSPLDRAMQSNDSNVRFYAGKIKDALDDALQRSVPGNVAQKLSQARSQYKAMKTIEDLAEKSPTGDISPALLMGQVRGSYGNMAYGGGGHLADLARIGQRFLRQPPDSGTPMGHVAVNALIGGAGAAAGGAMSGWDPTEMARGAALLPLTMAGARGMTTLLNQPQTVNRLLQRVPAGVPALNQLMLQRQQ